MKYETLKQVEDGSVLDKNGLSWKIFSSVLYDLAKSVSVYCKFMDKTGVRAFFDDCFQQWWVNTPNLVRLHEAGAAVEHGGASLKLKSYARSRTRSILSVLLKKLSKA